MHQTLQSVLLQYEDRARLIQDMVFNQNKIKPEDSSEMKKKLSQLEIENSEIKRNNHILEQRLQVLGVTNK